MDYITVKWLHILSSTVLFGTGIGTAYFMIRAVATRNPDIIAAVSQHVITADWIFTATTIVIQPLTGFYFSLNMPGCFFLLLLPIFCKQNQFSFFGRALHQNHSDLAQRKKDKLGKAGYTDIGICIS